MAKAMVDTAAQTRRIEEVYAKRRREGKAHQYDWHQQSVMLERYRMRAVTARMLYRLGWRELDVLEALDVGCGAGGWLRTLMEWGIPPRQLHGIDLLEERIVHAAALAPQMDLRQASGWAIPFDDHAMDLVTAHTVFSSILDGQARALLAQEMARVVKPDGAILVYDFRVSDPRNPETIGISRGEMHRLFPGLPMHVQSLTLPPPLSRRLSPAVSVLVEALLPILRTHRIYLIRKPGK